MSCGKFEMKGGKFEMNRSKPMSEDINGYNGYSYYRLKQEDLDGNYILGHTFNRENC